MMRALLVYPELPRTYWGLQYTLPIVRKGAVLPPLGLVTVAAHLPDNWTLRLVDLSFQSLSDSDILWADVVIVSGMWIQARSIHDVLRRCARLGRVTLLGGPAATASPKAFPDADIVFEGEIEGRVEEIITALDSIAYSRPVEGVRLLPRPSGEHPDLSQARVPRFDLLDIDAYTSMSIQYSRGCPFSCEFCDIIEIFGRVPRVKTPDQVLAELTELHRLGHRGAVFFVDDNFIGNKREVRTLLPQLRQWQSERGHPFSLYTEASINLAGDPRLIRAMIESGFTTVFVGIETPSKVALASAGKTQNLKYDLNQAVDVLTKAGLEVMGGFIIGFDSDTPDIFESQHKFIANSPIPLAMIGLLMALPGTALWRRLEKEGRLRATISGDQFNRPNFNPRMDEQAILQGYADLLSTLYTANAYFKRCHEYLRRAPLTPPPSQVQRGGIGILLNATLRLGLYGRNRVHFWRLLFKAAWKYRLNVSWGITWAISHAIQGEHMIRYTRQDVLPRIKEAAHELREKRISAPEDQRRLPIINLAPLLGHSDSNCEIPSDYHDISVS